VGTKYVENRQSLHLMAMILNFAAKPEDWVKKELKMLWKAYFDFRRYRDQLFLEMESWDCGRQDAWGDQFDQHMQRLTALRIARKIQKGNATDFNKIHLKMIGET